MQPKNLQQAFDLARRYNSIQLTEIKRVFSDGRIEDKQRYLTGFGDPKRCGICKAVKYECHKCIYVIYTDYECWDGVNYESFLEVMEAFTPEGLLRAYRARARHICTLIARHIADRIKKVK